MNNQVAAVPQTRLFPSHAHCAFEPGRTTNDAGHAHVIINGVVQPNPNDGHTHQILALPCQAPAKKPCNCGR